MDQKTEDTKTSSETQIEPTTQEPSNKKDPYWKNEQEFLVNLA